MWLVTAFRTVPWGRLSVRSAVLPLVLAALATAAPVSASAADGRNGVSARIKLPSKSMVAGATMEATVTVQNDSGRAVTGEGCGPLFKVALRNKTTTPIVPWNRCRELLTLPNGRSRYPVTLHASHLVCSRDGGGSAPICVDGKAPPLPPGKYRATLYQLPKVVAHPPSVAVKVTR
jgi:hypothetical protein